MVRIALWAVVAVFIGLNALALVHGYRLTHFAAAGPVPRRPTGLSAWQIAKLVLTGIAIPRPKDEFQQETFGCGAEAFTFPLGAGPHKRLAALRIPAEIPDGAPARGAVLLFHGYAASKGLVVKEAQAFAELGWDAVLVDFRGAGGSPGADTTIGWREAEDVAAAVEGIRAHDRAAGRPGRPVVVYGVSMGAAAAMRAVGRLGCRVDGLVLECPFPDLQSTIAHRFQALGMPAFPMAHLLVFWGGAVHGFWAFSHNPEIYAADIRCPALVNSGDDDPFITPTESARVAAALASPEKRHTAYPGMGHYLYMRGNPDRWRSDVAWLLDKAARRATPRE